ncbi:MAG: hypothetical protein HZA08_05445 [Nitrospirae bacterium]|nr:hypothetical protein [Nitrospirota bacterium]
MKPPFHDGSSENLFRRGKKTPPIHFYEDRRDILVPLISCPFAKTEEGHVLNYQFFTFLLIIVNSWNTIFIIYIIAKTTSKFFVDRQIPFDYHILKKQFQSL